MNLYEIYQPSSLHFNYNLNPFCVDHEEPHDTSTSMQFFENIFSHEYMDYPIHVDDIHANSTSDGIFSCIFQTDVDEFDLIFHDDDGVDGMPKSVEETHHESGESYRSQSDGSYGWNHGDHAMNPDEPSMDMPSMHLPSLVLPFEGMEVDKLSGDVLKFLNETDCESEEIYRFQSNDVPHEWNHDHAIDACEPSMEMTSMHLSSLVLPNEGMELDNHLCLVHLLMAYAKAMDNQEFSLSEVIAQRIIQRVNPIGGTTERVLNYMFQHLNKQQDYITQESIKNFHLAFKAFNQSFPHGKFAHFVAILAILEALPRGVEIIHWIDFDIGDGIQLALFMDAIKHHHHYKEIRITSMKYNEEDETIPLRWRFEETKRRLCDHSWSSGLKIEVEEVELQDLECFVKRGDNYGIKSWYIFNCNVGLPHMGRIRSRHDVLEFLRLGKSILQDVLCHDTSKGIITYVDGESWQNSKTFTSFNSFLDVNFTHYQALLESMEFDFPSHLGEARLALESLFVAPYVSSWGQKWEEKKECGQFEFGLGLEGWALSGKSLVEAKELVKEGVSPYEVRIEGEKKNEMVMRWNGVEMVRVYCWKV